MCPLPAIYERVHGPLRHLVVDEYQDINPAQERLIELLAQPPVELCPPAGRNRCGNHCDRGRVDGVARLE